MWKLATISNVLSMRHTAKRGSKSHARPIRREASPLIDVLEGRTLFSTVTVFNLSDHGAGSLRNAISQATANEVIDFAPTLKGTIVLTGGELAISKSLTIDGTGSSKLTVSGDNLSRVFDVTAAGASVRIENLTISHGSASNGGGIVNNGGKLTVAQCVFTANHVDGTGSTQGGGAIINENAGTLNVSNSSFSGNSAAAVSGANAGGGAIYNLTDNVASTTHVSDCTFTSNVAIGGGDGGFGLGGAILNYISGNAPGSPITVAGSTFISNIAKGGGGGGFAVGGAIWTNSDFSSATISDSVFTSNQAVGGAGGGFAIGGAIGNGFGATITISDTFIDKNTAVGGATGNALGGGFANLVLGPDSQTTVADINNCLLLDNTAAGGAMGNGQGGGIYSGLIPLGPLPSPLPLVTLMVDGTSIVGNAAGGGTAGDGLGGGIFTELGSNSTLTDSIVASNIALASKGGMGLGGGLYVHSVAPNAALFHLINSLVSGNSATSSDPNAFGVSV